MRMCIFLQALFLLQLLLFRKQGNDNEIHHRDDAFDLVCCTWHLVSRRVSDEVGARLRYFNHYRSVVYWVKTSCFASEAGEEMQFEDWLPGAAQLQDLGCSVSFPRNKLCGFI